MAKFNDSFAFSGTIGDLVGCNGPFGFYVRSRPRKSTKPPSVKQLAAREKMKTVMDFLSPLRELIHLGFASPYGQHNKTDAMNRAVSHVYHNALGGEYPHFEIDPSNVRLSQGTLKGLDVDGIGVDGDQLRLRWGPDADRKGAFNDDQVYLVAYNFTGRFAAIAAGYRIAGNMGLDVAPEPVGSRLLVYVCVGDQGDKRFSNSQFLGTIER
ncbi:DUF6266 family protein [Parapedobacter tibetensis]|uniref:DUF6266 family protein n=1 Tax=Parapedobacter tibetensis TaxID=2972951 RepID=UPI00214D7724|nr:DUF6266 family protein [Parapedobacter tibetensis]